MAEKQDYHTILCVRKYPFSSDIAYNIQEFIGPKDITENLLAEELKKELDGWNQLVWILMYLPHFLDWNSALCEPDTVEMIKLAKNEECQLSDHQFNTSSLRRQISMEDKDEIVAIIISLIPLISVHQLSLANEEKIV